MYTDLALYIDGKWRSGEGRKGEDVINPATGKALAHLPHASKADLDHALAGRTNEGCHVRGDGRPARAQLGQGALRHAGFLGQLRLERVTQLGYDG